MSNELSFLRAVARHSDLIRTGAVQFDYRTGQCGPVQATQVKSWGAACPAGFCPPNNLPAALGRYFAGDRSGCKEAPYTIALTATRDAANPVSVTVSRTSPITMCPTRLVTWYTPAAVAPGWQINTIQFGAQNQLIGGPAPADAFGVVAFQMVPMVPDCLRAGMPYTITATLLPEAAAGTHTLYLTFIGPMVG